MIQKHELPILEYDSNSEEVIKPNHGAEQLNLPEKCVYGQRTGSSEKHRIWCGIA